MSCDIQITDSSGIEIVEIGTQGPTGPEGPEGPTGPPGTTDHGALTGLADDDHSQYHNDARGDARYPLNLDGAVTGLTSTGGTETVTAVASGATMTLNMGAGPQHIMDTQDENTTLALSNAASGKSASALLVQGAGGGFTISVPGAWIQLITPSPTTTAGEVNEIEVWQVGTRVLYTLKGQA